MRPRPQIQDFVWLIFGASAVILATPVVRVTFRWGWWGPLLAWLGVIIFGAGLARVWARHDP